MEETSGEKPLDSELQDCFTELKKFSLSYKLGQTPIQVSSADESEPQNPLHKQFALILAKIDDNLSKHPKDSDEYLKTICMKTSILYEKAKILLIENQLQESKILLEQALNFISDFSENAKVCFLYLRIINHLTYVLSRLGELETARDLLLKAIADEEKCKPEVFSTDDLFMIAPKNERISSSKLNRLTINNMQMLSWVYGKMGNTSLHLKVQHDILQKQFDLPEVDLVRWSDSCFRLAGIFIGAEDYKNARHHLAAAESVLNPIEYSCGANPNVNAVQGELARSWVYYCLQLFDFSVKDDVKILEEKVNQQEGISSEPAAAENDSENKNKPNELEKTYYTFDKLDVDLYEQNIPYEKIANLEEAKTLFNFAQRWIKRGKLYYTLRDFPLQYVNLSLDLSDLHRFLAFYEQGIESKYLVQKKRYESLETLSSILKKVRPTCYVAVTVELTKEIIEAQLEMMNLNMKKLYLPSEVYKRNYTNNEDYLQRNMNALASLHTQLDKVSLNLDTNPILCQKRDVLKNKKVVQNVQNLLESQTSENLDKDEAESLGESKQIVKPES